MLPLSECPTDRDRRQIADENGLDRAGPGEVVRVNGRHDGLTEIELYKDHRRIEVIEYDLGLQFHAPFQGRRLDGIVVRRASGQSKITNALEVLQLQPLKFGQRIGLGYEQKQAWTCDCPFVDAARRLAGCYEPEVGLAEPQDLNTPLG